MLVKILARYAALSGWLITIGLISACSNRFKVDTSAIDLQLEVTRIDSLYFWQSNTNVQQVHADLLAEQPEFYEVYFNQLLYLGSAYDSSATLNLSRFITDPTMNMVADSARDVYQNFTPYKQQLTEAFKRYHYFFPELTVPKVNTIITGFNAAVPVTNDALGISLDLFLGEQCSFYPRLQLPIYKYHRFSPKQLVPTVMRMWLLSEFYASAEQENLLNEMVYEGKVLFILQQLLPELAPHELLGYTAQQYEWCENNERQMWAYLIQNDLLYNGPYNEYVKFLNEGPFTSAFGQESPAETGKWLGFQIVKAYMESNSDATLQDLIAVSNPQEILQKSNYKPSKF